MKILFKIIIGIVLGFLFSFIYKLLKNKKIRNEILIVSVMAFIFLTVLAVDFLPIGNTTIGSVFEKEKYTENYYIELYDENDTFIGKFPALIEADYITIHDENEKTYQCRGYDISKIKYDNREILCKTEIVTIEDIESEYKMKFFDSTMGNISAKIIMEKV